VGGRSAGLDFTQSAGDKGRGHFVHPVGDDPRNPLFANDAGQRVNVARARPPDAHVQAHIGIRSAIGVGAHVNVALEEVG
jgi:hypothetical protein